MPASPTKLTRITEKLAREWTVELLAAAGWTCERVDTRHPHNPVIAVDFLGVADLLAGSPHHGLMLVQVSADSHPRAKRSNYLKRVQKVKSSNKARWWVASGGRMMVIGWRLEANAHGGRLCEYVELTLADFQKGE